MPAGSEHLSALEAQGQLKEALSKAWDRSSAESTPLAVVLVAFDKAETPGDADILQRSLRVHCARAHDMVLRRSSEQFVAILPNTSPAGARLIGDRILEGMRLAAGNHKQSVSLGIAVAVPDDNHAPEELLRRAELALKNALEAGGDRCVGGTNTPTPRNAEHKGALAWLTASMLSKRRESGQRRRTD